MEKYHYNVEDVDQGTVALVADLAQACAKVQLIDVWDWAMPFGSTQIFFTSTQWIL